MVRAYVAYISGVHYMLQGYDPVGRSGECIRWVGSGDPSGPSVAYISRIHYMLHAMLLRYPPCDLVGMM